MNFSFDPDLIARARQLILHGPDLNVLRPENDGRYSPSASAAPSARGAGAWPMCSLGKPNGTGAEVRELVRFAPKATVSDRSATCRDGPILLQKSICIVDQKISGP
jgi:hypothetical protein